MINCNRPTIAMLENGSLTEPRETGDHIRISKKFFLWWAINRNVRVVMPVIYFIVIDRALCSYLVMDVLQMRKMMLTLLDKPHPTWAPVFIKYLRESEPGAAAIVLSEQNVITDLNLSFDFFTFYFKSLQNDLKTHFYLSL